MEKLAWVKELKNDRRGRISEYIEEFGGSYHKGKRPWGVDCDLAFPCATQNEIEEDDAKALLKGGCYGVAEGANMPSVQDAVDRFIDAKILYGAQQSR